MCNIALFFSSSSFGTYGLWSSFLAGGDVISAMDFCRNTTNDYFLMHDMKTYLPEWHLIRDPCYNGSKLAPTCKKSPREFGLVP